MKTYPITSVVMVETMFGRSLVAIKEPWTDYGQMVVEEYFFHYPTTDTVPVSKTQAFQMPAFFINPRREDEQDC